MKSFARFLNYVKIHTTSNPLSETSPSSEIQKNLGKVLVDELIELGINNAYMDKYGYVYATIPANTTKKIKTVGFVAHMDTSPDLSGENVNPKLIFKYDGEDVVLNKDKNIILSTTEFPFLKSRIGETLIVTDGTTLLGADDKAGIAEIMAMAEYFMTNPDVLHGEIKIAFTPDEEIGRGTDHFDVKNFKCDYCYTVDGGIEGSIDYENFNAASAEVIVEGINIHPGGAKGHMINSILIAQEFNSLLPSFNIPQNTQGYEGFNHLCDINGTIEKTSTKFLLYLLFKKSFINRKSFFCLLNKSIS